VGLACFGVFLAVFSLSRIVSLASVIAAISLPLLMVAGSDRLANVLIALVAMVLVLWRHRSNLQRLIEGTEPRVGQSN
jgi:Predicted membrane protein